MFVCIVGLRLHGVWDKWKNRLLKSIRTSLREMFYFMIQRNNVGSNSVATVIRDSYDDMENTIRTTVIEFIVRMLLHFTIFYILLQPKIFYFFCRSPLLNRARKTSRVRKEKVDWIIFELNIISLFLSKFVLLLNKCK